MSKVKNPSDIVDELVGDYRSAYGDKLLSVVMYGSAVTHEYRPGISDINIAVVLADNSIAEVARSVSLQKKWRKRGVATPFFMTREYIATSCDTYPVEFLNMRANHRVLHGESFLDELRIGQEHLRLQCERELKGAALHLRTAFVQCAGDRRGIGRLFSASMRRFIPVFVALLVLKDRTIPASKGDIVSAVEDAYGLGVSVLSEIQNANERELRQRQQRLFEAYVAAVDKLISIVDTMNREGGEQE